MKAKTTKISYSSKITLKIRDSFYSIEYGEEREIEGEGTDNELIELRQQLVDDVNGVVDEQAEEIVETFSQ